MDLPLYSFLLTYLSEGCKGSQRETGNSGASFLSELLSQEKYEAAQSSRDQEVSVVSGGVAWLHGSIDHAGYLGILTHFQHSF